MNTEKIPHLLVVDDDTEILGLLSKLLEKYSFEVSTASNGKEMWHALNEHKIDLIILDLMLPDEDGLSLCRKLRQESKTPVIMLTAAGDETDKIVGLELGADDYVSKPFNPRELLARIKAVLRRSSETSIGEKDASENVGKHKVVEFSGWTLDMATRQLFSPENIDVSISSGEFSLLKAFIDHAQEVLTREQLLELTQTKPTDSLDRVIDVQVSRLRQKIEKNVKRPTIIKTVRGGGYLFTQRIKTLK